MSKMKYEIIGAGIAFPDHAEFLAQIMNNDAPYGVHFHVHHDGCLYYIMKTSWNVDEDCQ